MAKQIGIALAGGGARGAYQIGAWKALNEYGVLEKVKHFSGASVGSLNAVLYAMGDYELAYDVWMKRDNTDLFHTEDDIFKRLLKEKLDFFNKGIFNIEKLKTMIEETVDFEKIKDKEVYVATTRLGDENASFFDLIKTNYKHFFKSDYQVDFYDINKIEAAKRNKVLLASCAIPVAFKPVQIDDKRYYDGGILDNAPYEPLIKAGCDVIIVIDLYTFSMMRITREKRAKLLVCYPKKSLRGMLDFKQEYLERRFNFGYHDMTKLLRENLEDILEE
ncbi:MAG: patatin-like phospholipase family protein [Candidatus Izemoplasma sp.]|nr:patatin-like phospholipase family protein [Candidatus Izemoplasma sp.]